MSELIDRQAFIEQERKLYCEDCDRRQGMKNGKLTFCYEIGDAPCRACWCDDVLTDLEDFPAAPRWVRCEEGLPEKDNAYAVCWTYQGVFYWGKVLFLNGEWQVDEGIPIPDYWMPIEPPKEEVE